jgi:hypothetical protein
MLAAPVIDRQADFSYGPVQLRSIWRPGFPTQSGCGLQIGACGRIAPEQGENVAAEDIKVRFAGRQPNRLGEVLNRGLGSARFSETHPAAALARLPETGVRPKRLIE